MSPDSITFSLQFNLANGDRAGEPNETFLVNLGQAAGGAAGAFIVNSQGVGVVRNDDR